MATFRAGTSGYAHNAASQSISAPAGLASGDYLIAYAQSVSNDGTFGAPSGWRILESGPDAGNRDPLPSAVFYKVAGGSEPGSYSFTFSSNGGWTITLVAYYNTTGTDAIANANSSGLATSLAAASVTTTQASETVVVFWAAVGGGSVTLPGGVTSRIAWNDGVGDGLVVGDYAGPGSPGSSAPGTASATSADWGAVTLTLLSTVPGAPTLQAPANSSYSDLAANGGPFTWAYNGALSETAYHYRLKISGGAYTYWNAGTTAFQSGDIANVSTTLTLTFGGSVIADGHTYNWSTASVDANGTSPYAADWTVTAQVAPTVTVSAPTGTVVTTQQPTVTWSDSLAPGGAQGTFRVVTYTAAQYGAGGFTPGSGPSAADSGVVTSGASTYTPANLLANQTSFRSYVQITQTPGGNASAWAFTSFSIALDSPAQPTITAAASFDPIGVSDLPGSQGTPRITLVVDGFDNLLTANQAALINGNTTGWAAGGGTTLSAVTSPTPPTAEGAYSMQMAGSVSQSAQTPTGTSGIAVLPSTPYTALASFRSASTARACTVAITWYTSAGATISTSTSGSVNDSSSAWTQALITATSPSNAAFAAVTVADVSAAENHYVAGIGLDPGTVSTWTRGGLVGSTTVAILRSDGLYVRSASTANPASLPASSQAVTVYDYEATPGTTYTYQAVVSAVLAPGQVASSPAGTSSTVSVSLRLGFWFIDPTNYSSAVDPMVTTWNPSQTEQSSGNQVLNQTTQNVVAGAMGVMDITASASTFSAAVHQAMVSLTTSQKTIFVSDPFGLSYYFRLGPQPGGMSSGSGNKTHDTQLNQSIASAPYRTVAITGIGQARPAV